MQQRIHKHIQHYATQAFLALSCLLVLWGPTSAVFAAPDTSNPYDPTTLNSINTNTAFSDPTATDSDCSTGTGVGGGSFALAGNSTWASDVKPPYYLEEYIVNILQDLAGKAKVPTTSTVTQEHVVALVAWTYAEGGNIANTGAFNIWNTGLLSRPDLLAGGGNASGLESFRSFNAGVEANAISITGSNQDRIGKILSQPSSTAEQVLHAIAYYDETAGNKAWAWGTSPNNPASVLNFNHNDYINSLTVSLKGVRSDYGKKAAVVIGPGEKSTHYVASGKLQYTGGAGSNATSSGNVGSSASCSTGTGLSPDCKTVTGNARILCDAKKYDPVSYQESAAGNHMGGGSPAWLKTCPRIDSSCYLDCSGLVNIAVYDVYGVDINETTDTERSDAARGKYWKKISNSELQPGDIVQVERGGHVIIFDHLVGQKIDDFAANNSNKAQKDQVSEQAVYSLSDVVIALRYIGQGS